ncbi:MAG: hypothetical protein ACYDAD_06890 [Acidimicrobiales bacterium]
MADAPGRGGGRASDPASESCWDLPGGLDIEEPRSWRTWQLVGGSAVALVVGMAIGYGERGGGGVGSVDSSTPAGRAASPITSVVAAARPGRVAARDRVAPTTTPGRGAGGTTAGPGGAGGDLPARQVVFEDRGIGGRTTARFALGPGGWALGWSYDCSRAGGQNGFTATVYGLDGAPSRTDPAVVQEGTAGSDVADYTSTGPRYLVINTACLWGVKVTGIPA